MFISNLPIIFTVAVDQNRIDLCNVAIWDVPNAAYELTFEELVAIELPFPFVAYNGKASLWRCRKLMFIAVIN